MLWDASSQPVKKAMGPDTVTYDCHTALVKRRERGENPNKQFCPVASSRKTPSQMTYGDHDIFTSQVPTWEKNLAVDSCLEYFCDMSSL